MATNFNYKLLSHLSKKRKEGGFTLIELLVVVIIIGVLAAVALPNLLGQVGKARETEGKNGVGSVNRAQQSFHFANGEFSADLTNDALAEKNALGVIIPLSKYYEFAVTSGSSSTLASITAEGWTGINGATDNGAAQGTRDYIGMIEFDGSGAYGQIICQATITGDAVATTAAADVVTLGSSVGSGCDADDQLVQ